MDREVAEFGIGEFGAAVPLMVSFGCLQWVAIWCIESAQPMPALEEVDSLLYGFEVSQPLKQVDWCGSFCSHSKAQELVLHCLHNISGVFIEIVQCTIFNA